MIDWASSDRLESVLRRRGHKPVDYGDPKQVLAPTPWVLRLKHEQFVPNAEVIDRYYQLFGKASFRKVARRLLAAKSRTSRIADLQKICGSLAVEYAEFLQQINAVKIVDDEVTVICEIDNLGPSLEDYVSHLCRAEMHGSAAWGVKFDGLPRAGGDYDVLAWLDPSLVYVETKSARIKDVSVNEVVQFLLRTQDLAPDLAILLIDSDEPIGDFVEEKVVDGEWIESTMISAAMQALPEYYGQFERLELQKHYPGVYYGLHRVYVTGSQPSILTQIRRCLQHFYARVRSFHYFGGPPINLIANRD